MTDGIAEHEHDDVDFVPSMLEDIIRANKNASAREIFIAVRDAALSFAPATDDMTLVVVKRVN